MNENNTNIKDKILMQALQDAAFDGWNEAMVYEAAEKAGYERAMAKAVFPEMVTDILVYLSDWADSQMLEKLAEIEPESMRVRDRIRLAVQTRLSVLKEHREALKTSARYWLHPFRKYQAAKMVWRTADRIWDWAGDTATDYNRYTKRGLLSGVLTSTMLYWMNDDSENQEKTLRFLDKRIENVMQLGKVISTVKTRVRPNMKSRAKPEQGAA